MRQKIDTKLSVLLTQGWEQVTSAKKGLGNHQLKIGFKPGKGDSDFNRWAGLSDEEGL